jgi:hypothetical protein
MDPAAIAELITLLEPEAQALILLIAKHLHRTQKPVTLPFPDSPSAPAQTQVAVSVQEK